MIDPRLLATYRRLAGRRDMNRRNYGAYSVSHDILDATLAPNVANAYQNAINDLCDAFQVTEGELSKQLEVT